MANESQGLPYSFVDDVEQEIALLRQKGYVHNCRQHCPFIGRCDNIPSTEKYLSHCRPTKMWSG